MFDHAPVFTVADIEKLSTPIPGNDTKNLFLRDEKRTQFVLICVRASTRVRLKELGRSLGIKGVTFASSDELMEHLQVTPGSVCLFALINEKQGRVKVYLDESLPLSELMQNHPLENTSTVVLRVSDMITFCESTGHSVVRIAIPAT